MDLQTTPNEYQLPSFTFHGSYTRSVDAKGRFALPFRFRQGGSLPGDEKYVVARGADGSLSLLPHAVWIANFSRMRKDKSGRQLRANKRKMSIASLVVEPDSQGRVAVPVEKLKEFGISKKITVLGMGSYMELWDAEALAKLNAESDEVDDDFMDQFYL